MAQRLSNWVNLQDIVKANEGAGQQMNDNVYNQLEQQGAQADQRLKKADVQFKGQAQAAQNSAFAGVNGATAAGAEKGSQARYTGPNSLEDVDKGVGASVADAAQRINASQGSQYQQFYGGGGGAKGSALDQALMGQAGGDERSAALKSKYGGLGDMLKTKMGDAQDIGDNHRNRVSSLALEYASKAPALKQQEERAALYKQRADIMAENRRRIAKWQADMDARNQAIKNRAGKGGAQIQASAAATYPELLPLPADIGGAPTGDPNSPFDTQFNADGSPRTIQNADLLPT